VKDKAAPPIWARFYEIETMKPIFIGRDSIIKYDCDADRSRAPKRLRLVCRESAEFAGKRLSEVEESVGEMIRYTFDSDVVRKNEPN
jgi:hypothetical protein